jgi:hypothetical protein
MHPNSAFILAAASLLAIVAHADGIYSTSSPVLQINAKNYNRLIAQSNHTSVSHMSNDAGRASNDITDCGVGQASAGLTTQELTTQVLRTLVRALSKFKACIRKGG